MKEDNLTSILENYGTKFCTGFNCVFILYCVVYRWYKPLIRRVLVRMIGYTLTRNYTYIQQYSAIAHLHYLHTTGSQAVGFPVSTIRLLATALNTETTKVSHFK
jgi:hypothetical protein